MSDPVALSILIVTYQSEAIIGECLARLALHPPAVAHEVIVLDNASTDGTPDLIGDAGPGVTLLRSAENLGFGGGVNQAAAEARGGRLLLLNPDAIVGSGTIDALWRFADSETDCGIWGGRTLHADGSCNPASCWGRMSLWSLFCSATGLASLFRETSLFNPEGYGGWRRDTVREVAVVTGCFLLIDRPLWDRLGGFDPAFFMYAEEADLCLRAAAIGARPAITPAAELIHLGAGGSAGSTDDQVVAMTRGRITLMRKHWSGPAFRIGQTLTLLGIGLRSIAVPFAHPEARHQRRHVNWRSVWRRRREWVGGYPLSISGR